MNSNNVNEKKMKWELPVLTIRDVGKDTEDYGGPAEDGGFMGRLPS